MIRAMTDNHKSIAELEQLLEQKQSDLKSLFREKETLLTRIEQIDSRITEISGMPPEQAVHSIRDKEMGPEEALRIIDERVKRDTAQKKAGRPKSLNDLVLEAVRDGGGLRAAEVGAAVMATGKYKPKTDNPMPSIYQSLNKLKKTNMVYTDKDGLYRPR